MKNETRIWLFGFLVLKIIWLQQYRETPKMHCDDALELGCTEFKTKPVTKNFYRFVFLFVVLFQSQVVKLNFLSIILYHKAN